MPGKTEPVFINILLVFPILHGKLQELGFMMSLYHKILLQWGKSRKERAEVEAAGNRYFTKLSGFLLFFFFGKKQIMLYLIGVG